MKPSVLISVALLMGALAVFLMARWIGVGGGAPAGPRVVVMSGAIEGGIPLMASHVRTLAWPDRIAPPGAFDATDKVIGRVVRQAMVAGEPVLESRLSPVDVKGGLSATLAPGKRAITVRVNDVIGVAGFALPGSWVDVLVSARDARNEPFSKIVLERVKVLAVAQETAGDPSKPKVVSAVTLELTLWWPATPFAKQALNVLSLAVAGYYLPDVYLRFRTHRRADEMRDTLPDLIDLLVICTESGLGMDAAINRVSQEIARSSQTLAEEFYLAALEIRAGAGRSTALKNLALRVDLEDLHSLVSMLVQADRFGTSLADSLRIQSEVMRTKRMQRAEEIAAKVPVKMLIPLIFFIFPALLMVLIGPAVLQISAIFAK